MTRATRDAALAITARQFREICGLELRPRLTNALEDGCVRRDTLFNELADVAATRPEALERLARACPGWLSRCDGEAMRAVAGYVAYCREDYGRAVNHFLAAAAANPRNLDNWLDLGFALRHQGDPLGMDLIFDHSEFMARFAASGASVCTLGRLRQIRDAIRADGADYAHDWRRHVPDAASFIESV